MSGGSIASGERSVGSGLRGGGGYGNPSPAAMPPAISESTMKKDKDERTKRIEEEVDRRAILDARRSEGLHSTNKHKHYKYILLRHPTLHLECTKVGEVRESSPRDLITPCYVLMCTL